MDDARNLAAMLDLFSDHWSPRRIATLNDYDVKLAKVQGDFVWHQHDDTDELFLVISGRLTIALPGREVELGPGELFVVPRGERHCPRADEETAILLLEPHGTINTGDAGGALTAEVVDLA